MLLRLSSLAALAFLGAGAPASAQIILGGEPVTTPGVAAPAPATLKIDFDDANAKPLALVVADFTAEGAATADMAKQFTAAIRADLASTGLFADIDPATWSAFEARVAVKPVFSDWTGAGVQALVVGSVSVDASSHINVQFRLYDTATGEQVFGRQYTAMTSAALRRLAHKASDNLYAQLTGGKNTVSDADGYFDSRIAFVSEAAGKAQLAVIDADGETFEKLLTVMNSIRRPRWSSSDTTLVYSANGAAALYYLDTGRREPALDAKPQPAPDLRFSADGRSLVYSRKTGANDEIVQLSLATRKEQVLAASPASDTAPSLSPDGKPRRVRLRSRWLAATHTAAVDGHAIPCAGRRYRCRLPDHLQRRRLRQSRMVSHRRIHRLRTHARRRDGHRRHRSRWLEGEEPHQRRKGQLAQLVAQRRASSPSPAQKETARASGPSTAPAETSANWPHPPTPTSPTGARS